MAEITPAAGGPYDYVQTGQPTGADEGETWYDVDGNSAYVYDGANWVEQTVTDHTQLSGIGASDHHSPVSTSAPLDQTGQSLSVLLGYAVGTDANGNLQVSDGVVDADTVDGNHASDLSTPASTGIASVPGAGWARDDRMDNDNGATQTAKAEINIVADGVRGKWSNNMSTNDSQTATLKAWDGSGTLVVDKSYTLADDETRTETVNITGTMIKTVEAELLGGSNQYGSAEVHSHKVGMPDHDHPI